MLSQDREANLKELMRAQEQLCTLQGLIVLFAGALSTVLVGPLARLHQGWHRRARRHGAAGRDGGPGEVA